MSEFVECIYRDSLSLLPRDLARVCLTKRYFITNLIFPCGHGHQVFIDTQQRATSDDETFAECALELYCKFNREKRWYEC